MSATGVDHELDRHRPLPGWGAALLTRPFASLCLSLEVCVSQTSRSTFPMFASPSVSQVHRDSSVLKLQTAATATKPGSPQRAAREGHLEAPPRGAGGKIKMQDGL